MVTVDRPARPTWSGASANKGREVLGGEDSMHSGGCGSCTKRCSGYINTRLYTGICLCIMLDYN
jgi:hypothetical protein